MNEILTIGHSSHNLNTFTGLLHQNGITAIVDVRSSPYSKYTPQYNRETLMEVLEHERITYRFLGHHLGARPKDVEAYTNGSLNFAKVAARPYFKEGLLLVLEASETQNLALMCSEKDPIQCHRMVLVTRNLRYTGVRISHILENGQAEANNETEVRLKKMMGLPDVDFFKSPEELVEDAYNRQAKKIAFHSEADNE